MFKLVKVLCPCSGESIECSSYLLVLEPTHEDGLKEKVWPIVSCKKALANGLFMLKTF